MLPLEERQRLLDSLTAEEAEALLHDWKFWARPSQLPPDGDWRIWLLLTGRGWGKTRTGAEWLRAKTLKAPDTEWAIVARNFPDARKVCVEGPSGLLRICRPGEIKNYNRSTYEIEMASGARVYMFGAEDSRGDVARGLNLSGAWCDELALWRYPDVWHAGLMPALRIGENPQVVVTTTPKPTELIRDLVRRDDGSVVVTRGRTLENADNLSEAALAELHHRYGGTRLGRQELEGELLEDVEGAIWTRALIEDSRIKERDLPAFVRIVVGVDPSGGRGETGIVAAGLGEDGHGYVLADYSLNASPQARAQRVVDAFREFQGDRVVAEPNFGGDMVENWLRTVDPNLPIRIVHSSRGKALRAEPVAALYEQGRVHHVGAFPELEDQMAEWDPKGNQPSPDRLDAMVFALTDLMLGGAGSGAGPGFVLPIRRGF